jgi:hypothetical protein
MIFDFNPYMQNENQFVSPAKIYIDFDIDIEIVIFALKTLNILQMLKTNSSFVNCS